MTEAILLVLDIGKSVGEETDSNGVSFFENAKLCASMIIQRKIFSKSDELGLILIGSERTNNPLDDGNGYQHIEVAHSLQLPKWNFVKTIASFKHPTSVDGDWLDGLVVALDFMKSSIEGKKFVAKQIVLFTNFRSNVCDDEIAFVKRSIKDMGVQIVAIGPHLYDRDTQGTKSDDQLEGEKLIASIVNETEEGCICSFEDAIPQLMQFEKTKQRSVPWRAVMEIGSTIKIPVLGYIKTAEVKRLAAQNIIIPSQENKVHARNHVPEEPLIVLPPEEDKNEEQFESDIAPFQRDYVYRTVADNPTPVDVKDVIEGYMFGSTIVPVSDDDKLGMTYQAGEKCFSILGFTNISNIPHKYFVGKGCMYFFPEAEENTKRAFSAMLHAMCDENVAGIVRKVYRKNACPQIGAIIPKITENCFVYIQLPYSQDMRTLIFPPLATENCSPSKDQLNAIDQLIEDMDLMALDEDQNGDPAEAYKPEKCLDPLQQHYQHFVARKILGGDSIIKSADALETVQEMLRPKKELSLKAAPTLKHIEELFPLTEIKQKEGTRRAAMDEFKSDVKLVNKDSTQDKVGTTLVGCGNTLMAPSIGTLQPQADFLNLIAQGTSFSAACRMMQSVILTMVENAFDEEEFNTPFKAVIILRKECISRDPKIYNDWITEFKRTLLNGKVPFWELMVTDHLGLISSEESNKSPITPEDANDFLLKEEDKKDIQSEEPMEEDLDDLINQM